MEELEESWRSIFGGLCNEEEDEEGDRVMFVKEVGNHPSFGWSLWFSWIDGSWCDDMGLMIELEGDGCISDNEDDFEPRLENEFDIEEEIR